MDEFRPAVNVKVVSASAPTEEPSTSCSSEYSLPQEASLRRASRPSKLTTIDRTPIPRMALLLRGKRRNRVFAKLTSELVPVERGSSLGLDGGKTSWPWLQEDGSVTWTDLLRLASSSVPSLALVVNPGSRVALQFHELHTLCAPDL